MKAITVPIHHTQYAFYETKGNISDSESLYEVVICLSVEQIIHPSSVIYISNKLIRSCNAIFKGALFRKFKFQFVHTTGTW